MELVSLFLGWLVTILRFLWFPQCPCKCWSSVFK